MFRKGLSNLFLGIFGCKYFSSRSYIEGERSGRERERGGEREESKGERGKERERERKR